MAKQVKQGKPGNPSVTSRIAGFGDLRAVRDTLAREAARHARAQEEAERRAREAAAEADIFRREVGPVQPLRVDPRVVPLRKMPEPLPMQTRRDEAAVLTEALSDEFDPDLLLDTDESLYYCRPGIGISVVRKLRRGAWIVQAQLDLHGMRREEARVALGDFLRESVKRGWRCVRVIHGKGLGSIGREPVLKGKVRGWLAQRAEVIAFCQARGHDGGAGAVLVLLQPRTVRHAHDASLE